MASFYDSIGHVDRNELAICRAIAEGTVIVGRLALMQNNTGGWPFALLFLTSFPSSLPFPLLPPSP